MAPLSQALSANCNLADQTIGVESGSAITEPLQRIIDRCAGHTKVIIPAGTWRTGQLHLRSGLKLELQKGAVLKLVADIAAFPEWREARSNGSLRRHRTAIYGHQVSNVSLFGQGKIDGSGPAFWDDGFYQLGIARPTLPRPAPTLGFHQARNISVSGITLQNTAAYALAFSRTEGATVSHLTIRNDPRSPNTDGIQIRDSRDITVESVDIRTGDDAIVLKSKYTAVTRILVKDSYLESDDGAIKFGTGSHVGVQDSRFENIKIANSRYGIAIFAIDGSRHTRNVFTDIQIETGGRHHRQYPIFVDIDRREADREFGAVEDLTFQNFIIITSGASLLAGNTHARLRNVTFDNLILQHKRPLFDLSRSGGKPRGNVKIEPQTLSEDYGKLQADFVLANMDGVVFRNMQLPHDSAERRTQLILVESGNVQGLEEFSSVITLSREQAVRAME